MLENGLTDEEKNLLRQYLIARLFEEPLSGEQLEEMNDLLKRDKGIERNLTPDEEDRMLMLVKMLYRGAELEPEEEKELQMLHKKQNEGIGSLSPTMLSILNMLKDEHDAG